MDSTQIESFLRMHNTVGTFLYFNDELQQSGRKSLPQKLNDFVITDPQWLVDMCKEAITHPEFLNERRQKLGPNERDKNLYTRGDKEWICNRREPEETLGQSSSIIPQPAYANI